MRPMQDTEKRVAMTYEFEDILKQLQSKKDQSNNLTEQQRMKKLNQILSQSVESFELNVTGNQSTKYDFIQNELNVTTPSNNIENCSIQILDGINVCVITHEISKNINTQTNKIMTEIERRVGFN